MDRVREHAGVWYLCLTASLHRLSVSTGPSTRPRLARNRDPFLVVPQVGFAHDHLNYHLIHHLSNHPLCEPYYQTPYVPVEYVLSNGYLSIPCVACIPHRLKYFHPMYSLATITYYCYLHDRKEGLLLTV